MSQKPQIPVSIHSVKNNYAKLILSNQTWLSDTMTQSDLSKIISSHSTTTWIFMGDKVKTAVDTIYFKPINISLIKYTIWKRCVAQFLGCKLTDQISEKKRPSTMVTLFKYLTVGWWQPISTAASYCYVFAGHSFIRYCWRSPLWVTSRLRNFSASGESLYYNCADSASQQHLV